MSWNIWDNRNLLLKLKSKLWPYHVVLKSPKTSPENLRQLVVEMQQLSDFEEREFKYEISCLKWTIYICRRKICLNFQTDTDKLNIVVYVTETVCTSKTEKLIWNCQKSSCSWENVFMYWATVTDFTRGALYWMKQLFSIKTTFFKNWCTLCIEHCRL